MVSEWTRTLARMTENYNLKADNKFKDALSEHCMFFQRFCLGNDTFHIKDCFMGCSLKVHR